MDTKLKNNRRKFLITAFLVIVFISAAVVSWYPKMDERITNTIKGTIYENDSVLKELSRKQYVLLKKAMEYRMQKTMTVKEVFFSTLEENSDLKGSDLEETFRIAENIFHQWDNNDLVNLDYYILDNERNISETNTENELRLLLSYELKNFESLSDIYDFCAVISFDSIGRMSVENVSGTDLKYILNALEKNTFSKLLEESAWQYDETVYMPYAESKLSNFTIVYAIPKELKSADTISRVAVWAEYEAFADSGIIYLFMGVILFIALIAILLGGKKIWYKENGFLARIPLEVNIVILFFAIVFALDSDAVIHTVINSEYMNRDMYIGNMIVKTFYVCLAFGKNMILWIGLLFSTFISVSSLKQIFIIGVRKYLQKRTIIGYLIIRIKKFILSLGQIDLTEKSNKIILKYVLFHGVIMTIISFTWFFGIFFIIPYSVFLYLFLRKYFLDMKEKYAILLKATSKISEGNLNVEIRENLGVFEPFKMELEEIQTGFRKAVEEEVKSQKMKTELITNVSHDLKTPLTAIITYIDLLKGEQITEEERKSYIDTLERKSQRLKTLIEDLFEVSKADSRNVKLDIVNVDVIALMKQVQFELQDRLKEQELDVRWNVSQDKVIVPLDSQKTFRIFENLMNNIVKYAQKGSRVYIDVWIEQENVMIILKNVSKEELNIGAEEITERFIRGDRARNTEGSGLGLSIVRSFVELQGGSFQIVIDGDLFKSIVIFKQ